MHAKLSFEPFYAAQFTIKCKGQRIEKLEERSVFHEKNRFDNRFSSGWTDQSDRVKQSKIIEPFLVHEMSPREYFIKWIEFHFDLSFVSVEEHQCSISIKQGFIESAVDWQIFLRLKWFQISLPIISEKEFQVFLFLDDKHIQIEFECENVFFRLSIFSLEEIDFHVLGLLRIKTCVMSKFDGLFESQMIKMWFNQMNFETKGKISEFFPYRTRLIYTQIVILRLLTRTVRPMLVVCSSDDSWFYADQ